MEKHIITLLLILSILLLYVLYKNITKIQKVMIFKTLIFELSKNDFEEFKALVSQSPVESFFNPLIKERIREQFSNKINNVFDVIEIIDFLDLLENAKRNYLYSLFHDCSLKMKTTEWGNYYFELIISKHSSSSKEKLKLLFAEFSEQRRMEIFQYSFAYLSSYISLDNNQVFVLDIKTLKKEKEELQKIIDYC